MSMDEQKAHIQNEGLEGELSSGGRYANEGLEVLAGRKHETIERRMTREQAPAWMAPFGFVAGPGASMLEPVPLAAPFVSVVGEGRVMSCWPGLPVRGDAPSCAVHHA